MRKIALLSLLLFSVSAWAANDRHIEYPTYSAHANGLSIAYQDFGDPKNETVLLIMGLGAQLIHWNDEFVLSLVNEGFRVIRFDNRDAGWSQYLSEEATPGMVTLLRYKLGISLGAPYKLDDMAADAMGLLDQLNIKQAHIVGASMGGMIAQIVAADYPARTLSLTSIMSTSGAAHLPQSELDVGPRDRSEMSRAEILDGSIAVIRSLVGSATQLSDEEIRTSQARGYDRARNDAGFSRQLWAIMDSGDRVEKLQTITAPTLVVHGKDDRLIPYQGGEHTAELIPNSKLLLLDGMGHYMGPSDSQPIVDAMMRLIKNDAGLAQNGAAR
ncbi:MAG: pimeloyl-ACP methyl ester carboxylesterase [Cryomorphaceae bacterium]|jgi:pimeloyl-ACP methyl ester carboxylesterase